MFEFKFNDIGEGLEEGKIADILVKEGQSVKEGDSVFSVETDKVTTDLPAPVSGVITKILVKPGDTVHVGTTIAYIEQAAAGGFASQPMPSVATYQPQQPSFVAPSPVQPVAYQQPNLASQDTVDFVFTDVGEGLTEGKVADIFKKVGDAVKEGDAVFSVETDKVTTDLYAPKTGTIAAILVQVGQNIHVGQVLAKIGLSGSVAPGFAPQPNVFQNQQQPMPQQFVSQPQFQVPSSQPAGESGASVVGEVKVSNKVLPLFGNQKKK